jgi:hypothetical protein
MTDQTNHAAGDALRADHVAGQAAVSLSQGRRAE